jgi:hypothetical protein
MSLTVKTNSKIGISKQDSMKNIALLLIFILSLGLVLKANETEKRELRPFREVSLRLSANLYIEQGDNYQIEINADGETLDRIIVEVVDHKLIIRFSFEDMFFHGFNPGHITLKVTTPTIDMLSVTGSGNIIAEKPIDTRVIELFIAGSGDIKIADLKCERLEAEINGSGDIIVSGKPAHEIDFIIAGSGNLLADQLEAEYGKIRIAGSGNCDVNVSNFLEAKIFGSGDIRYSGNPKIDSMVSGSGRIRKRISN